MGGKHPAIYDENRSHGWKCNLVDYSNSGIDAPSLELLDIHSRFARAIRWTRVAAEMSKNTHLVPGKVPGRSRLEWITSACLAVWLKFPA